MNRPIPLVNILHLYLWLHEICLFSNCPLTFNCLYFPQYLNISRFIKNMIEMIERKKIELLVLNNLVWFILIGFFLFMGFIIPRGWFTLENIDLILYVSAPLSILAFGAAIIFISGVLDISLAENVGFTAVITGLVMARWATGLPGFVGIIIIVAFGTFLGMINGFFVGKMKLSPILVTISTLLIYMWMTRFFMSRSIDGSELPGILLYPGSATLFGFLRVAIIIFIVIFLLLHFVMNHTSFGNKIYAVGGNPSSAEMLGINVGKTYFWAYTIGGALAGVAALIWVGFVGAIPATLADRRIFEIFAAVFIGGIGIHGGRGSLMGVLGGVLLLATISAGLAMLAVDPELREALTGVVLIAAVIVNKTRERLIDRILMPQ
jgi:ribose/xylose/arabinose/galactoside ABC-type transport system permease subunit